MFIFAQIKKLMEKIDALNQVAEFHKTFNAPILDQNSFSGALFMFFHRKYSTNCICVKIIMKMKSGAGIFVYSNTPIPSVTANRYVDNDPFALQHIYYYS